MNILLLFSNRMSSKKQHKLAHALLHKQLGYIPDLSFGEHGKPYITNNSDLHFNLSHSKYAVACITSSSTVGIDIEEIRPLRKNVMKRAFSEKEQADVLASENPDEYFFQLWTLKESYVKAIGIGISFPMNNVEFCLKNNIIQSNIKNADFLQYVIGSKFVVSVCKLKS
ncbi:MAG: 4'-phosphopantetheinyl transferase superfamily protein [Ruminococcus sp.]|nr:4'-phosphopantetheinyl transferase superfamily protein [Ruminococcus sp.]